MADNPNKKKEDAKRISQQPHEKAYQKSKEKKATIKKASASKNESKNR